MDGHVRIKDVKLMTMRRCWMALAEADDGFGYQELLVSGSSANDILGHLRRQYRRVTIDAAIEHQFKESIK